MKPLLVSHADIEGGAARAAYRLHRALLGSGIESALRVRNKQSDDWTVIGPASKLQKTWSRVRGPVGSVVAKLQRTNNENLHSINMLPSRWSAQINRSDADLVNLHWIAGDTISIEDVGRIRKPLVWTMHDMWPFCGAEHYAPEDLSSRWRVGYETGNRPPGHTGLDLDRLSWKRKLRAWRRPMHVVCPSSWLAECVKDSALMSHWPISVIPNALDVQVFKPLDRMFSRVVLNFPTDKILVMFGAIGGGRDSRKGFDLLHSALGYLGGEGLGRAIELVVFGQSAPRIRPSLPFPVHWCGHVHDDPTLALLYSAVDVMVVPSRQENLPQAATEAQACGCPVVAFNATGFKDVVEHQKTGYLADAFDVQDLAQGIGWILEDAQRYKMVSLAARQRAVKLWSPEVVVPQYLEVYKQAVESAP